MTKYLFIGALLAAARIAMAGELLHLTGHLLAGFTAIAHVYMGVLLHKAWISTKGHDPDRRYWLLFWAMNVVEVGSAIVTKIVAGIVMI